MPEGSEIWRSYVDSADIQPLGTPYGYQLEIPFEDSYLTRLREASFFDDPRNLRGLIGNINFDEQSGRRNTLEEVENNALQVKRDIRGNPKLMQDLSQLTASQVGLDRLNAAVAGLEDAYSIRQILGETPGSYGAITADEANPPSRNERGVVDPATGERVRMYTTIPTSELSPFDRTAQTSFSLQPYILAADIEDLGSPNVVDRFVAETGIDPNLYGPLKAQRVIQRSFSRQVPALQTQLDIDLPNDPDSERLRSLLQRDNNGVVTFGPNPANLTFPGEFVENLQRLQRNPNFDPGYVYSHLDITGTLPDDAFDSDVFEESQLNDSSYYEGGRSSGELRRFAQDYPETLETLEGTAKPSRIGNEDLFRLYGDYIPKQYKKLPLEEVSNIKSTLLSYGGDNPDMREAVRGFDSDIENRGYEQAITSLLDKSKNILNKNVANKSTAYLTDYLTNLSEKTFDVPTRATGVGGLDYDVDYMQYPAAMDKLNFFADGPYIPDDFEPTLSETFYSNTGDPYTVSINRVPDNSFGPQRTNEAVLSLLENKPYAGTYNISFKVNDQFSDAKVPDELKKPIMSYVSQNFRSGLPLGSIVTNTPLGNEADRSRGEAGNKRSLWYQQMGFGANTEQGQYGYIDPETGNTVPIQPFRPRSSSQGKETFKRSYYSVDPIFAAPALGAAEFGRALRRTPSALLPGAADLIPSPEAIRTGYREGPAAMGRQMGQEFIQSLPAATAVAGVLSLPAAAPFAPGIGAGMVGAAGARALNEVVKQETGEGIVPKLRQVIGTEPRSGVASPTRQGPVVTPQIRPLTPTQRTEMQRRQNRNELQRRIDLMGERFNPAKGEFGLTELLFGR